MGADLPLNVHLSLFRKRAVYPAHYGLRAAKERGTGRALCKAEMDLDGRGVCAVCDVLSGYFGYGMFARLCELP